MLGPGAHRMTSSPWLWCSVSLFQPGICLNVGFIISYHRQASSAGQGDSVADYSGCTVSGVPKGKMWGGKVNFSLSLAPERGHPALGSLLGPGMEHLDFLDKPPAHPESASPETHAVGQEQELQNSGLLSTEKGGKGIQSGHTSRC